jgi:2-isopropylmalate synthase
MTEDSSLAGDTRPVVEIYDTTLRDGSQREGISYTLEDKLRIAERLDGFGVSYIEGGWPGSNPKDMEFFERGRERGFKHAKLSAFGMTRRAGGRAEDDKNLQALILAGTPACTVVGKTSTLHVTEVVRTTLDENLKMIEESVAFLCGQGREVIYDAEHFFDGYKLDAAYGLDTVRAD